MVFVKIGNILPELYQFVRLLTLSLTFLWKIPANMNSELLSSLFIVVSAVVYIFCIFGNNIGGADTNTHNNTLYAMLLPFWRIETRYHTQIVSTLY